MTTSIALIVSQRLSARRLGVAVKRSSVDADDESNPLLRPDGPADDGPTAAAESESLVPIEELMASSSNRTSGCRFNQLSILN
jgi:hypothetical protein